MKTFVIEQKQSGTGSIHDTASDLYDRVIKFRGKTKFALVYATYYNAGYKTFESEARCCGIAAKEHKAGYSFAIIDSDGTRYDFDRWQHRLVALS